MTIENTKKVLSLRNYCYEKGTLLLKKNEKTEVARGKKKYNHDDVLAIKKSKHSHAQWNKTSFWWHIWQ